MAAPERSFLSLGAEATEALGEALGRRLVAGAVVALTGELGSGKTTLVRGLARGLEVDEPVTSPTFALMHEYEGRLRVHHLDAWMRAREESFLEGGAAEVLGGEGVALVEWAERVTRWLPEPHLAVELRHHGRPGSGEPAEPGGERWIRLRLVGDPERGPGAALEAALASLEAGPGLRELGRGGEKPRGE